jgi:hypothetical protein
MMDVRDDRNWPHGFSVWAGIGKEYLDDDVSGTRCIARTPDGTTKENMANARLIAAAPELLTALKNVLDEIHKHHKMNVRKDFSLLVADSIARKAIAKAEGREL